MKDMLFIVGLGNPGSEYVLTRHNVGFRVLDQLATQLKIAKFELKPKLGAEMAKVGDFLLVKPQTYMNQSGQVARAVFDFYRAEVTSELKNLYVIHDDLDLELGKYKIQFGKGPKVHHGLQSIYQHLKTDQFHHVRVGVDSRFGDRSIPGEDYVLQKFTETETKLFNQTVDLIVTELIKQLSY